MKPKSSSPFLTQARIQVGIVLGSFIFTLMIEFFTSRPFFSSLFLYQFLALLAQIEVFIWIGRRLFKKLEYNTVREFMHRIVGRLLLFYLVVLLWGFALFVLTGVGMAMSENADPMEFIRGISQYEIRGFVIGSSIGVLIGSVVFFVAQTIEAITRLQKLQEEKLKYQYQTLKNQLNPHFLFNNLNTLSSLVHTDAMLADRFIQKMASTYRYILSKNDSLFVSLEDELSFVRNYFYLQELRGKDRYFLEIDKNCNLSYQVLPVSVQLLVENAIKHNAATAETPLTISLWVEDEKYLVVKNNKQKMLTLSHSTGTGLENLGERVRQICQRDLVLLENYDEFVVKLPILKANENIAD